MSERKQEEPRLVTPESALGRAIAVLPRLDRVGYVVECGLDPDFGVVPVLDEAKAAIGELISQLQMVGLSRDHWKARCESSDKNLALIRMVAGGFGERIHRQLEQAEARPVFDRGFGRNENNEGDLVAPDGVRTAAEPTESRS